MTRGYWQIPLDEESVPILAFVTPFGHFQWRYMPFGLRNTPATFSRIVVKLLRGLDDFSGAYMDDIINFSQSWKAHADHLRTVLTRPPHLESDPVSVRGSRPQLPRPPHWPRSGPTSPKESRGTARLHGSPEQETALVVPGTF